MPIPNPCSKEADNSTEKYFKNKTENNMIV